jgi:nitrogen fixation NifU-like protein
MESGSLYHEIVLRHKRNPHNLGTLDSRTHTSQGINAMCGDRIHVDVDYREARIQTLRYHGESCAIAIASASIMSDMVIGFDSRAVDRMTTQFSQFVEGDFSLEAALGELSAFAELRKHPSRRKCALLPWATLRAALSGAVMTSTEAAALPR